jgi:hypothetical protein
MMKTAHPLGPVHGRWRPIVQRLMEPFPVGKAHISCQTLARVPPPVVVSPIDLLIFDTRPPALHADLVQGPPAAIPAETHASLL